MLTSFIRVNRDLCNRIERRLPHTKTILSIVYEELVAAKMNAAPGLTVVDVGGGQFCPFAGYRDPAMKPRIVAVDVSAEELRENRGADETRVADIMTRLPFEDDEVDLVVSRSTLEHLRDVDAFVGEAHRILKPGGWTIHLLPCRNAPFAVLNRALPPKVSRQLLHSLRPESRGIGGFPAVYDRCSPSALCAAFTRHGFTVESMRYGWYQSRYFSFFVPMYLGSVGYELAVRGLGASNLCAHMLLVARREG